MENDQLPQVMPDPYGLSRLSDAIAGIWHWVQAHPTIPIVLLCIVAWCLYWGYTRDRSKDTDE